MKDPDLGIVDSDELIRRVKQLTNNIEQNLSEIQRVMKAVVISRNEAFLITQELQKRGIKWDG